MASLTITRPGSLTFWPSKMTHSTPGHLTLRPELFFCVKVDGCNGVCSCFSNKYCVAEDAIWVRNRCCPKALLCQARGVSWDYAALVWHFTEFESDERWLFRFDTPFRPTKFDAFQAKWNSHALAKVVLNRCFQTHQLRLQLVHNYINNQSLNAASKHVLLGRDDSLCWAFFVVQKTGVVDLQEGCKVLAKFSVLVAQRLSSYCEGGNRWHKWQMNARSKGVFPSIVWRLQATLSLGITTCFNYAPVYSIRNSIFGWNGDNSQTLQVGCTVLCKTLRLVAQWHWKVACKLGVSGPKFVDQ